MYKINWKKESGMIILILMLILSAFVLYNKLPQRIPMHWNINGVVDRYVAKSICNVLIIPLTTAGLYLLMLFIPYMDKKKYKYEKFLNIYYIIRLSVIIFMAAMYVVIILSSLGYKVPVSKVVPGFVGVLFLIVGKYMGRVGQNSFIGIKLPWTLKNEHVWNKTNRLGGYLFISAGVMSLVSLVFKPIYTFLVLVISIFLILMIVIIYSYLLYHKIRDDK